jgi:GWxTD domain-containing protein
VFLTSVACRRWLISPRAALALLAALATLALPLDLHSSETSDDTSDGQPVKGGPATHGLVDLEDMVGTPEFDDVLSRSFECILADSQLAVYSAADDFGRFRYRKRFWTRCDPTPATDTNEFLEEHLRRLAYTLANFCPANDTNWDQRGEATLRFGLPTGIARYGGDISEVYGGIGLDPPGERWMYADMNLTLSFIDPNLDGWYQLGFDTKYMTAHGRPEVQVDVRDPLAGPYDPPEFPVYASGAHDAEKSKEQQSKGLKTLEEVPVSFGYSSPTRPLPLYYEIVTARGTGGRTDMAINYQVPRRSLTFEENGQGSSACLAKRLRLMTEDYEVLRSWDRSLTVLAKPAPASSQDSLIADEWRFNVEPGDYVIGFSVEDTLAGRSGSGRSLVTVPDYTGGGLSMSDIQLAKAVGAGSRFVRMGGAVLPNPVHVFGPDDVMIIYFELYGLKEEAPGRSKFAVTTEVSGRLHEGDRSWLQTFVSRFSEKKRHSVSSSVVGWGEVPDTAYWYALSLDNMAEDNYDLTVRVKDMESDLVVTKTAAFTVLEN